MEIFSTDEKAGLPDAITVTFSKAEAIAVLAQLVAVKIDDPRRADCKAAFTKLIHSAHEAKAGAA